MGEIERYEGGYIFLAFSPSPMTAKSWTVSMRMPLQSFEDPAMEDLQVDTAIAGKTSNVHGDGFSRAERIDRSSGRGLYRSESSFILMLQIWEDY